jgi:hypothetical protein
MNQKGWNKHHPSYNRADWHRYRMSKIIREHPNSLIPMLIVDHNELHHQIGPVKPPTAPLARLMISQLVDLNHHDGLVNLLDQTNYLADIALEDSLVGQDALRLSDHYFNQIVFIQEARRKRGIL